LETFKLVYKPLGSIALLIEWPQEISTSILRNISLFREEIHIQLPDRVLETVPAYCSLTVFFDTKKIKYSSVVKRIKEIYKSLPKEKEIVSNIWKIPVCYDVDFGIDLKVLCKEKKLSQEKFIDLHSRPLYDVYFIGFLPGFLYLGGLSAKLNKKRKAKPRTQIIKGAVGIAGDQTGIYPRESPGGWNIIGNSPINFFDVEKDPPCFAKPGDKIQFIPINREQYNQISEQVEKGTYKIEIESHG
jgi:inhibitor of KinA